MTVNYRERNPLDAAQDDLTEIDATIARLQEKRAKIAAFIEMYGQYAKPLPISQGTLPRGLINTPPTATAPVGQPEQMGLINQPVLPLNVRIGNYMYRVMGGTERALAIGEIYEILEKANLLPGGTNPKQAISAILGKDRRFTYKQGEGWRTTMTPSLING